MSFQLRRIAIYDVEVGFFDQKGIWCVESKWKTEADAQTRAKMLNKLPADLPVDQTISPVVRMVQEP